MIAVVALDERMRPAPPKITLKVYVAVALPAALVAVIVKVVAAAGKVGLPVIKPVDGSNDSPGSDNAGESL